MGAPTLKLESHPLIAAVNERIMRDEARHARLSAVYLEWAASEWTDDTRAILARAVESTLRGLAEFWKADISPVKDGVTSRGFRIDHLHELGWLESARAIPLAREVAQKLLEPLAERGVAISSTARAELFAQGHQHAHGTDD
jgi:hypothetical protein